MQTNNHLIIKELKEHLKFLDKMFADDYPLTKAGQTFIRRDIERIIHMIVEMKIKFKNKTYDFNRHGGPFDRGAADSYYGRTQNPHYFTGKTYLSEKIVPQPGSLEYKEYLAGYHWNEECGDKKDWG